MMVRPSSSGSACPASLRGRTTRHPVEIRSTVTRTSRSSGGPEMLTPQPPLDMVVGKGPEMVITVLLGFIAAVTLLCSLAHWVRTRRPVMPLLFVTGGAMMVFEPMVDTVGGCWFPANSTVAFHAWGRPIPLWLCLAYFFYFGIASAVIWIALRRGVTRAQLWMVFGAAMVGDLAFEWVLLTVAPYAYFGYQPLRLGNFPLWWMAVNGLVPIVLGAAVYRLDDQLRGRRVLAIIPIGLTVSAAVNASVGWPSWLVINTNLGWAATQLGGIATFALAGAILDIVARFVARDAGQP